MTRGNYLHGLQVWSFKVRGPVLCGKVYALFLCVCTHEVIISLGWGRSDVGVIGLRALAALVRLFSCCAEGGFYGVGRVFCFWKALLPLTNFAKASMPFFVPRIVVSMWSGPLRRLGTRALHVSRIRRLCDRAFGFLRHKGIREVLVCYV